MSRYRMYTVTRYYPLCFVDRAEPNDTEQTALNLMSEAGFVRTGLTEIRAATR